MVISTVGSVDWVAKETVHLEINVAEYSCWIKRTLKDLNYRQQHEEVGPNSEYCLMALGLKLVILLGGVEQMISSLMEVVRRSDED